MCVFLNATHTHAAPEIRTYSSKALTFFGLSTQEQALQLAAGLPLAVESGREDLGIVQHQAVSGAKIGAKVAELTIEEIFIMAVQDQQPGCAAFLGRALRNQLRR